MAAELSPQAKLLIPEEWANRARCPVCGSVYLSLKRSYSDPDQLACDTCNARFEISQDGCFVRVMFPPPGLPRDLMGQWVDPSVVARRGNAPVVEARKEAQVHKQAEAETRRRALPEKPVTTESLLEQARRLLQLGNSRDKVQATLEGVPPLRVVLVWPERSFHPGDRHCCGDRPGSGTAPITARPI
ncbi:MAG TPA: hypothetical protein PJ988_08845 [Anaerolinea sp.]|nr:hypothetical protein [Anaerolinea sp.]